MYAYTDESGSTGLGIFNEQQPVFLTLTLLSTTELDPVLSPRHAEWLKTLKTDRLHGSELRIEGLEKIAPSATQFLELADPRFILTTIDKPYFGAAKFVDTVLDSGLNKAVSPVHYGYRALRLPLALALVQCLTERDLKDFWSSWRTGDTDTFVALVRRVREGVRTHPGARERQLLGDALEWAAAHPAVFLQARLSKLDAPNVVALSLIVGVLHELVRGDGRQVLRFVHDRQQEFGRALKGTFEAVKQIAPKNKPVTSIIDLDVVQTFGCSLELVPSGTSSCLQLVDCLLWLLQRVESVEAEGARACLALLDALWDRTIVTEFSFSQLVFDVEAEYRKLMSIPLSAEKLAHAQQQLAVLESLRLKRTYERDDE